MCNQWKWMIVPALIAAASTGWIEAASGQEAPKAQEKGELKSPDPIPEMKLLPDLPTIPIRRGAPTYNEQMVDASLLPRDKEGIWVLDFAFKSLRMVTIEVSGKRKIVHYLAYRVVNRTGKPREFVPQFTLVTDTGKRYEEAVIPSAVKLIQGRENAMIRRLGAVDIAGIIPPSTKEGVDDAVFGVAMWEGVDPHADGLKVYIRGLSDGWNSTPSPDGGKPVVKYKTLRIDLIRRGDERNLNEKEIQLADPPYEWIYW